MARQVVSAFIKKAKRRDLTYILKMRQKVKRVINKNIEDKEDNYE